MRIPVILLLFICFGTGVFSQNERFTHIDINDGLSQNSVYAILKDSQGFMWFGTKDGLNRYDGASFKVFKYDPLDSTTISGNHVTILFEDDERRLWVGTENGGLSLYDPFSESFLRVEIELRKSVYNGSPILISDIAQNRSGHILISTRTCGLILFNPNQIGKGEIEFTHHFTEKNSNDEKFPEHIISMSPDDGVTFWLGTKQGLTHFNSETGEFSNFQFDVKDPKAPITDFDGAIHTVLKQNDGSLWMGTLTGLVHFNPASGYYDVYPSKYAVYRYGWGRIYDLQEDTQSKFWMASATGIFKFDPNKKDFSYISHDPNDDQTLSYDLLATLYIDDTGIVWAGTSGMGVDYYDPLSSRFKLYSGEKNDDSLFPGFSVRSIFAENDSIVWISCEKLFRWNRASGALESFERSSNELNAFGNTGARSILKSRDGLIYLASTEGLFRYNPESEEIRLYQHDPLDKSGLPQRHISTVYEDSQGKIWAASNDYVSRLDDEENGVFKSFQFRIRGEENSVGTPALHQIATGELFIGCNTGFYRLNPETGGLKSYLNDPSEESSLGNNYVKTICADPNNPEQFLWLGTGGGGLNKMDLSTETFTQFLESDGLPNNVVYCILPDNEGNLWCSTNKGLSRFNPKGETFRNFDVQDNLQSNEFNTGAAFRSPSGELFFGGIKGLNYFQPSDVKDNPNKPSIVFTEFRIANALISHLDDSGVLKKSISQTDEIILSHDLNNIYFEFRALNYTAPGKNQYAYKLEGFDEDWVHSGNRGEATYTNVSPGKYTLRVRASNNDGVWNEAGIAMAIEVLPPWWLTWQAYFLYIFLFLLSIYLIRKYELNRIRIKNQLELEQVQTHTLRNLDEMKTHFFANISHEFRTPLTLILGQAETLIESAKTEKDRSKLSNINNNAKRLLNLINQLMELTKLEAGMAKLNLETQNIVPFIKNLVNSFESMAQQRSVQLEFSSSNDVFMVSFDRDKGEKIFTNLISNALKFTPEGGKIEVALSSNEVSQITVSVSDTGCGIPADKLPHVFDRFYQVDASTTREFEGTGIGLSLVKELVEIHSGRVEVESSLGKGTKFKVIMSLVDTPMTDEISGIKSQNVETGFIGTVLDEDPSEAQESQNKKDLVLVVEDNSEVRSFIVDQLSSKYRVLSSKDGLEGLETAIAEIPDLVITDVMMPRMDGNDLTKRLKEDERTSHIPVIMLTGKSELDQKLQGLETGSDAYITKPFSVKELQVRVRQLIFNRKELRKKFSKVNRIVPSQVSEKSIDQKFLEKLHDSIEAGFADAAFGVESIAEGLNMSVSQLNRKVKGLLDQPPGQLLRSYRLKKAEDLLMANADSIGDICFMTGFSDQAYFSRAFKKHYGKSPGNYLKEAKKVAE